MKKLLVALTFVLALNANASHLLGGYIQTVQRGYSDTVDVIVTLFTDPQGIPGPGTISLQEYKLINNFYQTNSTFNVTQQSATTWQGVNVTVYTGVRVLTAGDYRFIYTNCCRGILVNSTSSMNSNFTIALDYKKTAQGTITNSAPVILNPLPINWVVNDTSQSILFAVDLDGDSVVVEMDDALNQYANGVFVPMVFTQLNNYGYYNVDSSGVITWAPSTQGQFATGYKVSEYRNGALIGVNRIQQVYITQPGSTPNVVNLNPIITADLLNGDSTYFATLISNATTTSLIIPNVNVSQASNSTWSLTDLQVGTYKGVLRASSNSSNKDYYVYLVVTSTIGIEENIFDKNVPYVVYDWNGRYIGNNIEGLKGWYVIIYDNNKVEKIFVQ